MTIKGEALIGANAQRGTGASFKAFNPTTGETMEPAFASNTAADVDRAAALASAALDIYRETSPEVRAAFLERIGDEIVKLGDALIERATAESGLPTVRLQGERARTVGQLKMFAQLLRRGDWIDARIDVALPDRQPLPRPDLRLRRIPIGPVAVFGASNFPLAFSVAGGDTASALAAGAPVIVKAHPAHPGTSELVGQAIQAAVKGAGLPEGGFSMLFDSGFEVGSALVAHPAVAAVGFTGSRRGGLALMKIAQERPVPIPVYAEMSSINPVYLLPAALAARGQKLARGFVDSLVLGTGQFCTNPGVVLALAGQDFEAFVSAAAEALAAKPAGVMLTQGIQSAYQNSVSRLQSRKDARAVAQGQAGSGCRAQPQLFRTTAAELLGDEALAEEVFGPASLLVECKDLAELHALTERLEGQLTATLQMDEGDHDIARSLLPALERKVGRILANGWPTGVEVSDAMVHGGPFPSTSDGRSTSVGTAAIERFLRPVSYQSLPDALLPAALQAANPWKLPRLADGKHRVD
ncbi:aldehyde dehydrogenase (NADP(+)) [Robbsia andropogonis]|uniref:aldehyde dehydrogenase (NADP(+)) n=1 Tax=Robbsia andropogonis TaxID=28092 RepID=UPI003D234F1D